MYAIIECCGKQYKVSKGDVVFFEKLDTDEGENITFDNVILVSDDGKVEIGTPYVKGAKVEGKVLAHGKGKKIVVFKMKAKKNYRKRRGHRQPYTKVEILSIVMPNEKKAETKKVETKKAEPKKAETKKAETKIDKKEENK